MRFTIAQNEIYTEYLPRAQDQNEVYTEYLPRAQNQNEVYTEYLPPIAQNEANILSALKLLYILSALILYSLSASTVLKMSAERIYVE